VSPDGTDSPTLATYLFETMVARGGMGEVWRGVDPRTRETVAIKRLALMDDEPLLEEYRARLVREAEVLKELRHENIVRCLDVGVDDESGWPFLVLEWLEGEDLASRQLRSPLSQEQALDVVKQCLSGLAACHEQDLVHRDIKPGNLVLVGPPERPMVKVVDFGVALVQGETTRLTQAGTVIGTLHYLSPEQARGDTVDTRTDLYSVGVLLYELLTGILPFVAQQPVAVLFKIATETPRPPREIRLEIPEHLEQVVLRAMQRLPGDRFQSAGEMLAALEGPETAATIAMDSLSTPVELGGPVERRLVSLLCVNPLEQVADVRGMVKQQVKLLGGAVQRLLDGRLFGVFGLEQTAGDETLRCLQAGLALRDALGGTAQLMAATVHVETGQGIRIDTEELERIAVQLAHLPTGELIVDPATEQLAGGRLRLKQTGGQEVVEQLELEEPGRRPVLGAQTPTVGRDAELAGLRTRMSRAEEQGEPEAVVVFGPPGIGKSRVLSELLPELRERSTLCLVARPDSTRAQSPYSLIADAVQREAGIHVGQDEAACRTALEALMVRVAPELGDTDVAAFIGEAVGIPFPGSSALRAARSDPKLMRRQVAAAFEHLIAAAGEQGLVSLCLEDLQWSDEESLRLCEHLLERLDRCPLFVLASSRPELLARQPDLFSVVEALYMELRPLGRRSLRRLIEAILGRAVPAEVEALIAEQWDGNPFFAEELVSWVVDGGVVTRAGDGWEVRGELASLEIPASLHAAIQGRLDRLSPDLKQLAKAVAVLGETVWEAGCVALGFGAAEHWLGQLQQAELLVPVHKSRFAGARQWRFRHALLQQVAYEMLLPDQRRELHARAGSWLESMGEPDAAVLARHFQLGGEPARAAHHFGVAGDRALADGEPQKALRFYEQSLSLDRTPELSLTRTLELARAHYLLGQYEEGLRAIQELEARGDLASHRAATLLLKARLLFSTTEYATAEALLREAADAVPPEGGEDLSFEILHTLFWVIWARGRYEEAGRVADQISRQARELDRADQLCVAKLAAAYFNVVAGDLSRSVELAAQAVEHARSSVHPYREVDSLILLASARELVGLYDDARQALRTAHGLATQLQTENHLVSIETTEGRVSLLQGQHEDALASYRSAIRRAELIGEQRSLALALVGQARALAQSGSELPAAEEMTRRALDLVADRAPPMEAEARATLALLLLARGQTDEALDHARSAVQLVDRLGAQEQCEIEILLAAREVLSAAGHAEQAAEMLEQAQQRLESRAQRIDDAEIRQAFLERVPHHVRVRELAGAH
jgi:tetratricopeptide (TPR) repeat protein